MQHAHTIVLVESVLYIYDVILTTFHFLVVPRKQYIRNNGGLGVLPYNLTLKPAS